MIGQEKSISVYAAGPFCFLHDAKDVLRRQAEICDKYGLIGRTPLDTEVIRTDGMTEEEFGLSIYQSNARLMRECDIIIANLTPFRGPSADAGTVFELGWFAGAGKPAFGYSNTARPFQDRTRDYLQSMPDPLASIMVESFGVLPDNLMIPGGLLSGGLGMVTPDDGKDEPFDSLVVFEKCVRLAARKLGIQV